MKVIAAMLALILSGCAATYAPPTTPAASVVRESFAMSRPDLMRLVRRAVIGEGLQILSADDWSGTLSTLPQDQRLTPRDANCGTTLGLDYLKDNRTSSRVAYGFVVDDGMISVRAVIQSEYKPGAVDQNITLSCVSHGTLEQQMLQRLRAAAMSTARSETLIQ